MECGSISRLISPVDRSTRNNPLSMITAPLFALCSATQASSGFHPLQRHACVRAYAAVLTFPFDNIKCAAAGH